MTRRTRLLALLTLVPAIAGLGWLVLPRLGASPPPENFAAFAAQCATFQKANVYFENRGPSHKRPYSGLYKKAILHAHADGRWSVDDLILTGRMAWADGTLTYENLDMSQPKLIEGYGTVIADIWTECRNGFDDTDWTLVDRPEGAHASPSAVYARLDFPFEWAEAVGVYLGADPYLDVPIEIVVHAGSTWYSADISEVDFGAAFPEQALSRESPYVPPPMPDMWRDRSAAQAFGGEPL